MTNLSPYRSLPAERRASLLSRAMTVHRELRQLYVQRLVARGGGFRAVTLQSWPLDRLAKEIVRLNAQTMQDELDLLHLLYVELEPAIQITFLDAAGVGHDQGKLPDDLEPPYAEAEAVQRAAREVLTLHGADGLHYLRTIGLYNAAGWPGLDAILAEQP